MLGNDLFPMAVSSSTATATSRYCVLLCGNLVTWKIKEETVVARSSAEVECKAMVQLHERLFGCGPYLRR